MDSTENAAYWEANAETRTQLARAGYDVYRDRQNAPAFLAILMPGFEAVPERKTICLEGPVSAILRC